MGTIKVENIRLYAYHGCLKEEAKIGSDYRVDVEIKADLSASSISDELAVHRILEELPSVEAVNIAVSKINPPIGGEVAQVTVVLSEHRN